MLTYSLGSLFVVLAGMWLTLRPPSARAMVPDTGTIGYEVTTLGLGILAAEVVVRTLVLTPIVIGLAICLHRSSLVSGLHRSSRTDPKTGLLNNRAWNEHATGVLSRSQRDRQPVTVLFCDLDHFKAVNDTHGHLVGDRVLVAVADCFRRELRGHDGLGRYGGEEFVVILDRLTIPWSERRPPAATCPRPSSSPTGSATPSSPYASTMAYRSPSPSAWPTSNFITAPTSNNC